MADGIRFFDLDQRFGEPAYNFAVDHAEESILDNYPEHYSSPNVLTFGGYSPGAGLTFGRCGEFKFSIDQLATEASAEFFWSGSFWGNSVRMEALLAGAVVATDNFVLPAQASGHFTLAVSGSTFDTIRIRGLGADDGIFFAVVDNVLVDAPVASAATTWGRVKSLFVP